MSINPHDDAALNRLALKDKSTLVTLKTKSGSVSCAVCLARKIITILEKGGEQVQEVITS